MLHFQDPEHDEEQVDAGRLLSAAATLRRREGGEGRRKVKAGRRGWGRGREGKGGRKGRRAKEGGEGGEGGEEIDIALATDIIHNNYKLNHRVWRQLAHTYIVSHIIN